MKITRKVSKADTYLGFLIPLSWINNSNLDLSNAFVKRSARLFSVGTFTNSIKCFSAQSLIKWWRISMCLVLLCLTGLFVIDIVDWLSILIGVFVKFKP